MNEMNVALTMLIDKRNHLASLSYSDTKYDELEEVLHELEDDFLDEYGDYLDKVLTQIHEKNFPESDVLSPIAYLAKKYAVKNTLPDGTVEYNIPAKDGVWVEASAYPNKDIRLILLPNPPRLIMHFDNGVQKEVWNADKDHVVSK